MSVWLETQDLTLRYGETTAIDRLSVELAPGRIHGLLGRNGSGKTSLLSVIAGFRRATEGEVLLDGQPVFDNPVAMSNTCLIRGPGDTVDNDWPGDRVRDALTFAATMRPHWDPDVADRLCERFRLDPKKRLGEMSRGQRSSVGVTLGLASTAPLTMFDESYLGMDAPSRYAFYDELLASFAERPRTIVISTHLIEEVASLFQDVTVIDEGRLVLTDDADAVRARGATLTGPAEAVDALTDGLTVLAARRLGPTKAVTVYGELEHLADRANGAPVELEAAGLQDLFVHLTEHTGRSS